MRIGMKIVGRPIKITDKLSELVDNKLTKLKLEGNPDLDVEFIKELDYISRKVIYIRIHGIGLDKIIFSMNEVGIITGLHPLSVNEKTLDYKYLKYIGCRVLIEFSEPDIPDRKQSVKLKPNDCECESTFDSILGEMSNLYHKKNSDYGNSFDQSLDEFGESASLIRMTDKLNRLKTLMLKNGSSQEGKVTDESIDDTLIDLANYCIMTVSYRRSKR